MCDQIFADRCPDVIRSLDPKILWDLRATVARHEPITARAAVCISILQPHLEEFRGDLGDYSKDQCWLVRSVNPYKEHEFARHLVIRLDNFVRQAGGKSPVNLRWCVSGKGMSYYGMQLRRLCEIVSGAPSWRYQLPDNGKPQSRPSRELQTCHNRFGILASMAYATDTFDDVWVDQAHEGLLDSATPERTSIEERQYVSRADANKMRARLGQPPKDRCSVYDRQYKNVVNKVERNRLSQRLARTILRPYACALKDEKLPREELHTTAVRLYFAVARWYAEWRTAEGIEILDFEPGVLEEDLPD